MFAYVNCCRTDKNSIERFTKRTGSVCSTRLLLLKYGYTNTTSAAIGFLIASSTVLTLVIGNMTHIVTLASVWSFTLDSSTTPNFPRQISQYRLYNVHH